MHSDKPGLWVAAAQWEFETLGNEDNGRQVDLLTFFTPLYIFDFQFAKPINFSQILLRGLRFLPTSWTLHRLIIVCLSSLLKFFNLFQGVFEAGVDLRR